MTHSSLSDDERLKLEAELTELRERLEDRKKALPAHTVRPHQIIAIEELEERIAEVAERLSGS